MNSKTLIGKTYYNLIKNKRAANWVNLSFYDQMNCNEIARKITRWYLKPSKGKLKI